MARPILMIAYHYPPCFGSSGLHRTLKFSQYLLQHGWKPTLLTPHPRAYPKTSSAQLSEIPDEVSVTRAFSLDAARHLSVRGAYPSLMALPDRWASWWLGAVPAGLRLVRAHRPAVIWSTFPIATAHLIGFTLHRLTGLPWVADFRDPMTEDTYPKHRPTRLLYQAIERRAARHASRLIFTTESSLRLYRERYPDVPVDRWVLIPNGYDEEDFRHVPAARPANASVIRLVHSGLVYPEERDPRCFFQALARLVKDGRVSPDTLRVELRGCGSDEYYAGILRQQRLENMVHLLPSLPYREALSDCADASALVILQAALCNAQIPAKTYEYLRLHKPILALTAAEGDTARLLRTAGGATIVDLQDEEAIYAALPGFLAAVREGLHALPNPAVTQQYERHNHARQLATCLTSIT